MKITILPIVVLALVTVLEAGETVIHAPATAPPIVEGVSPIAELGCDCGACDAAPLGPANCPPPSCFWGSAEYLLWWRPSTELAPLISTGVLGDGGEVLFGGDIGGEAEPGFRGTIGLWLDPQHASGVMARYFTLAEETDGFDSTGLTNVARPFIDLTPGSPVFNQENAVIINDPTGDTVGQVVADWRSRVWGLDVLYRMPYRCSSTDRIDLLIGYQTTSIDERLRIRQSVTEGGVTIDGNESFRAENEFHGGVLGMQFERNVCRWSCSAIGKVGFGNMSQMATIQGAETRSPPFASSVGSLLALPSNIGTFSRDEFTFVPEVGVQLGYKIDYRFTVSIGYSFIYWDAVNRVEDQIDRSVNGTQVSGGALTGDARPAFSFSDGSYWVQGLNFGLSAEF